MCALDNDDEFDDAFSDHIEVNFERLIVAHLEDADFQLARAEVDGIRLFLAARSIHLALVTALSCALSGSSSIGAMAEWAQKKWLAFFESNREGLVEAPETFMAPFDELLERAQTSPGGWLKEPLSLDDEEKKLIARLVKLRHWAEHPTPTHMFLEESFLVEPLPLALKLTLESIDTFRHRFDDERYRYLDTLFRRLEVSIARYS